MMYFEIVLSNGSTYLSSESVQIGDLPGTTEKFVRFTDFSGNFHTAPLASLVEQIQYDGEPGQVTEDDGYATMLRGMNATD